MSGYALLNVIDKVVLRSAATEYQRTRSAISDVHSLSMINCTITLDQRDIISNPSQLWIDGDFKPLPR